MTNYTNKIAGIAAIALAALPLVAIAGIAEAAPATVQISDLDLSTAEGQSKFKARVKVAAAEFCKGSEITGSRTSGMRSCVAAVQEEMTEKLAAQQGAAKTYAAR